LRPWGDYRGCIPAYLAFKVSKRINNQLDKQKGKNHITTGDGDIDQEKKSQKQIEGKISGYIE
jgi:hypothetical protein